MRLLLAALLVALAALSMTSHATEHDVAALRNYIHELVPLRTERDVHIVTSHILGKTPRELAVELTAFKMEIGIVPVSRFDAFMGDALEAHGQSRASLGSLAVAVFHAGHAAYDRRDTIAHYSLPSTSHDRINGLLNELRAMAIDDE